MASSPDPEPVPGPKKKRLPFKRTVPRQAPVEKAPDGDSENNDIDFFRRRNDIMPMVLQDMNRSPTPERMPTPDKKGSFHLSPEKRERKRIKLSPDSDEYNNHSLQAPASASKKPAAVSRSDNTDSDDLIIDVKGKGKEIYFRTPTKRKISNPGATSASALRLIDSDDDLKPILTPSQPPKTPTPRKPRPPPRRSGSGRRRASPVLIDVSDDDKPDIMSHLADLDADSDSDLLELDGPPAPKEEEEDNDDELAYWIQQAKAREEETQSIILTVVVTSRIAGTKPVMIRRRMNQVIRPVLKTWIDRQRSHDIEVPKEVERGMFLTWKEHKVYSSSTLASLGIQIDPVTKTVKPGRDGGFRGDMLHIEVWTEEAWADHLRETEQQRKQRIGIYDDDSGGDGAATPAAKDELAAAEQSYNVRLKSQDQTIPCKIRPDYTVKEIVEMFREIAKLGKDRDISIWFDGEQLDEDALAVEAAELEPDEVSQLEVRVK